MGHGYCVPSVSMRSAEGSCTGAHVMQMMITVSILFYTDLKRVQYHNSFDKEKEKKVLEYTCGSFVQRFSDSCKGCSIGLEKFCMNTVNLPFSKGSRKYASGPM